MRKILTSLLILLYTSLYAKNVDNSYNKIIENGKEYYLYEVQESEGFMAIARKFGVAYQDIIEINKEATKDGLKVKQILRIPVVAGRNTNPAEVKSSDFVYHKVTAGETLFFISRMYKVGISDIVNNNPGSDNVLSLGQELKIPKKGEANVSKSKAETKIESSDNNDSFYYHTIKPKETAYGISKNYNIKIQDIVANNPGLETNKLKIGMKIRIPKNKIRSTPIHTTARLSDNSYLYHRIKSGETLESIATQYSVPKNVIVKNNTFGETLPPVGYMLKIPHTYNQTVANANNDNIHIVKRKDDIEEIAERYNTDITEIKSANPDINKWKKLKKGTELVIPTLEITKIGRTDSIQNAVAEHKDLSHYFNIEKKSLGDTINVSFIWPLFLERNDTINNIVKTNPITKEEFKTTRDVKSIYPSNTVMFREFFYGALMAINDLKKQGVKIRIRLYDTNQSAVSIMKTIDEKTLLNSDIIFGPAFHGHLKTVSDYCLSNQIRLIVPYISENSYIANNPYIYQIFPSVDIEQAYIANKVAKRYKDANFIVVKSKNGDNRQQTFIEHIKNELYNTNESFNTNNITCNQISYKEINFNRDQIGGISALLNKEKQNIIVIPDKKEKLYTRVIPIMENYSSKHKYARIKLLGFSEYQFFELSELESLFNVECELYTPLYADLYSNDTRIQDFRNRYTQYYDYPPTNTYPYYSLLGYDAIAFFISGLDSYGNKFESNIDKIKYDGICVDFDFQRINNWGGFINKSMYGIQYTDKYNIELIAQ